ncbi:MAG TPA: chemotaxis protein CheW [Gemmatimonadaceae bacterium]|nr:chemotaxis protein CheW [Gemmatimonadaceae bacterium]
MASTANPAPPETPDAPADTRDAGPRTLLFRAGGRVYGAEIEGVREIVPWRHATRLPGAPASVQGLINLRGIVVTVLDLAAWMDAATPHQSALDGSIVLVQHGTRVAGIAVDEVLDVQPLAAEPLPDAESGRGGVVRGLGRLDDMVVILLDIHTLVRQVLL